MDLEAFDIQTLIVADIIGTITPEEKDQLRQLMTKNPELQELYENIREELERDNVVAYAGGSTPAYELISRARWRVRVRVIKIMATAACTITIVGGLIYYTLPVSKHSEVAWEYSKNIVLKVGEQQIDLENNNAVNVNGFVFHPETGMLRYNEEGSSSLSNNNETLGELSVPRGKNTYKIVLNDGTVVLLKNTSRLTFPLAFKGPNREISITGEAYVHVAPNAGHPFIVNLPENKHVEVLGTEFNVNTYDSGTAKIALVKGSVKIKDGAEGVLLTPGKEAIAAGKNISVTSFNEEDVLSWREGIIRFPDNATVEMIAAVAGRNMNKIIEVEESAAGKKFDGVILDRSKSIEYLLQQLTDTKEVAYNITEDGVIRIE